MGFLNNFHDSGAPPPKEFVCDGSRALLNAAALTYSPYPNIDVYAKKIKDDDVVTRIRMDVAHFQNVYKNLLKDVNRRVRCLYLASTGQLLMTQDLNETENIVKSIFLLAKCESEGKREDEQSTQCSKRMLWMTQLVTGMENICINNARCGFVACTKYQILIFR